MADIKNLKNILITMEAGGDNLLSIRLSEDGSLHRMGSGTLNNPDRNLYIGINKDGLFDKLKKSISKNIFKYAGYYSSNEIKGLKCELTIFFQILNEEDTVFNFIYGSESIGPPPELCDLIVNAVNLTNGWWLKQRGITGNKSDEYWSGDKKSDLPERPIKINESYLSYKIKKLIKKIKYLFNEIFKFLIK